jgi:hypothetical protein
MNFSSPEESECQNQFLVVLMRKKVDNIESKFRFEIDLRTGLRGPFLTSPLGAKLAPRGEFCPPGANFVPWG